MVSARWRMCWRRPASSAAVAAYISVGTRAEKGSVSMMRRGGVPPAPWGPRGPAAGSDAGARRGGARGVGIDQANRAAALGPQHARVQAVAGAEMALARVIVDQPDDEMQLQVGARQHRVALDEAPGLREIRGQQAGSLSAPAQDLA